MCLVMNSTLLLLSVGWVWRLLRVLLALSVTGLRELEGQTVPLASRAAMREASPAMRVRFIQARR